MVSSYFTYDKPKVIQALRYHFISRREIKVLMIFVNVFAILSAALFFFKKISPLAFLISSALWFVLMVLFWFILPQVIYAKANTFKDRFRAELSADEFAIENERGRKGWEWPSFSTWMESPHFFHLYFNSRSFFIVPKDAFEGEDVHEARRLITAKIKK
ncbi:MAG: YcxB family protein [Chitinophagaceae bacterium]|nr:MAG: YcxB family protein [Chitinophagaceae bacterium]